MSEGMQAADATTRELVEFIETQGRALDNALQALSAIRDGLQLVTMETTIIPDVRNTKLARLRQEGRIK